jgi:hypothetical protein
LNQLKQERVAVKAYFSTFYTYNQAVLGSSHWDSKWDEDIEEWDEVMERLNTQEEAARINVRIACANLARLFDIPSEDVDDAIENAIEELEFNVEGWYSNTYPENTTRRLCVVALWNLRMFRDEPEAIAKTRRTRFIEQQHGPLIIIGPHECSDYGVHAHSVADQDSMLYDGADLVGHRD